ncbi:MAG: hypothetical protein P4L87_14200, partial [Formivibrio sp.]|nr:hypothetical protein [Formivibrio sp.]
LPALSGGLNSNTRLEEIHEPRQTMTNSAAAAASASSSASAMPADSHGATPLLSLAGRESILDHAYDSDSSIVCQQCAALIPKARFTAHLQYWCQAEQQ